jgi:hypothetical protein
MRVVIKVRPTLGAGPEQVCWRQCKLTGELCQTKAKLAKADASNPVSSQRPPEKFLFGSCAFRKRASSTKTAPIKRSTRRSARTSLRPPSKATMAPFLCTDKQNRVKFSEPRQNVHDAWDGVQPGNSDARDAGLVRAEEGTGETGQGEDLDQLFGDLQRNSDRPAEPEGGGGELEDQGRLQRRAALTRWASW